MLYKSIWLILLKPKPTCICFFSCKTLMKMTSKIIKAPWLPYFPSQYSKIALICWVHGSGTWYWWVLYSKLVSKWMKQGNAFQSVHEFGDFLGIFDKFLSIFLNAFAGAFHNESWNETKLNCCVHLSVHKRREREKISIYENETVCRTNVLDVGYAVYVFFVLFLLNGCHLGWYCFHLWGSLALIYITIW